MAKIIDGIEYSDDMKSVVGAESRGITSAVIADGVRQIGEWAFWDCTSLVSVVIPMGATEIGNYAFKFCNITEMEHLCLSIKNGVAVKGGTALYCAHQASEITMSGIMAIGGGAFSGCTSLVSAKIPAGVTEIGNGAFLGCSSLSSVEIPQSVTKIGWSAFGWCDALSSVVFAGTKAEWNAVEKERYWLSEYSAIECVQCADGVVKR